MNNITLITIGDINGIGIQILIDLWKRKKINKFLLFTNEEIFKKYLFKNKIKIKINCINSNNKRLNYRSLFFNIFTYNCKSNEDNTYKSLDLSYDFCKQYNCIGILTLPLSKHLIIRKIDKKFIGHTEYYQKKEKKMTNMILYYDKLIFSPLTTHISLRSVSSKIKNIKNLFNKIKNLNMILKKDFNIKVPKIIISGLNPHSGEKGKIGIEEDRFIKPLLKKIRLNNIMIDGPYSADSMLIETNIKKYDCFLFMYHDQALIPFKYISKFRGVNFTGNLDIIRTSPDHGTAYDKIGGKNVSDKSILECFKLIKFIHKNRNNEKG